MELWEMSDGRIWQLERLPSGLIKVCSLLSNNHLSRIGDFDNEKQIEVFALNYMRLTVKEKVKEED